MHHPLYYYIMIRSSPLLRSNGNPDSLKYAKNMDKLGQLARKLSKSGQIYFLYKKRLSPFFHSHPLKRIKNKITNMRNSKKMIYFDLFKNIHLYRKYGVVLKIFCQWAQKLTSTSSSFAQEQMSWFSFCHHWITNLLSCPRNKMESFCKPSWTVLPRKLTKGANQERRDKGSFHNES